jgi:Secretion system C-terminal sorting domain/Gram-negative bacterial TonB protein C-terminal
MLQFIADKEGNVGNIRALTKHGFGMEQECIRVMKLSPKWNPAMQNGIPVKAYRKQPFTFVITGDPDSDPITEKEMAQLATVYPNPTDNNATILFNSNIIEKGEVRVYDVMSNLKLVSKVNFVKGGNKVMLNVSSLGAGTYIITINGTNGKVTKSFKLIKK